MKRFKLPVLLTVSFLMSFALLRKSSPIHDDLKLYLPEDLEVKLWAESPMFFNPTNMDVDARGRIWITEAVNYRNFNNDSTSSLHHERGDRIVILEDTDQDGKADKSTVFAEDRDLVSPLGIAVIGNQVVVSCSPNLIVYTDKDGDDKPDQKEILLKGFGGLDHDHSLHSVVAGPDGKWHFNTGNAGPHIVTDKSGWTLRSGSIYTGGTPYNKENKGGMVSDDGRIWVGGIQLEVNPNGSGLRPIAHGFRNSFETCIDSYGDMWQNDNDDQVVTCRVSWLMEGGHAGFFNADGSRFWQADQRPGQDMFTAHWHQEDPGFMPAGDNSGAGSPTGVVLNEGDGLGQKYRGMLFSADAGRNLVFGYMPALKGSGFELKGRRTTFITSLTSDNAGYVWNDKSNHEDTRKWFRPSDVMMGTDGAMYIADWYDPVVGGHQMRDSLGYGRIYRITPKGKKLTSPLIDFNTKAGIIAALESPAANVRGHALSVAKTVDTKMKGELFKHLMKSDNPYHRARALWLYDGSEIKIRDSLETRMAGADIRMGVAAFRVLRSVLSKTDLLKVIERRLGRSAFLDREMAIAMRDFEWTEKGAILKKIIGNYHGNDDYMLETIGLLAENHEAEVLDFVTSKYLPANMQSPSHWNKTYARLVWRLHAVSAVPVLKSWIRNNSLPWMERNRAITALAYIKDTAAVSAMFEMTRFQQKNVRDMALYWMAFRQGNEWSAFIQKDKLGIDLEKERHLASMLVAKEKILNVNISLDDRCRTAANMAKDEVGGRLLLGMRDAQKLPSDLFTCISKGFVSNPDVGNRIRAQRLFPDPEMKKQITISKSEMLSVKSDIHKGQLLFQQYCSSCHKIAKTGGEVGPDLTFIGKKLDRSGVIQAIQDPNASIVFGYEPWIIETRKGESFFGFLYADGNILTLRDLSGTRHNIQAAEVVSRKKELHSIMPSGASLGLDLKDMTSIADYLIQLK
jgi:putative membrane-bound dehydrogenase-like protein